MVRKIIMEMSIVTIKDVNLRTGNIMYIVTISNGGKMRKSITLDEKEYKKFAANVTKTIEEL